MSTYHFSLEIDLPDMNDSTIDRLYEAGCDDAGIGRTGGRYYAEFDREAETLEGAIESATNDVRKAGFHVLKISTEESNIINSLNEQFAK